MNKFIIIICTALLLVSCTYSNKEKVLIRKEATFVIFYSNAHLDTLSVDTFGKIYLDSHRGTNSIYTIENSDTKYLYENTAPVKRIHYKETIIR